MVDRARARPGNDAVIDSYSRLDPCAINRAVSTDSHSVLRTPVPGPVFGWAKVASWVKLVLFAGLVVVWLAPGLEHATFYFGLAPGSASSCWPW